MDQRVEKLRWLRFVERRDGKKDKRIPQFDRFQYHELSEKKKLRV